MTSLNNGVMDPIGITVKKEQACCYANRGLRHYEGVDPSVKQRDPICGGEVWSSIANIPLPYNLTSDHAIHVFRRLFHTLAVSRHNTSRVSALRTRSAIIESKSNTEDQGRSFTTFTERPSILQQNNDQPSNVYVYESKILGNGLLVSASLRWHTFGGQGIDRGCTTKPSIAAPDHRLR